MGNRTQARLATPSTGSLLGEGKREQGSKGRRGEMGELTQGAGSHDEPVGQSHVSSNGEP